jgi:hypothetical protein
MNLPPNNRPARQFLIAESPADFLGIIGAVAFGDGHHIDRLWDAGRLDLSSHVTSKDPEKATGSTSFGIPTIEHGGLIRRSAPKSTELGQFNVEAFMLELAVDNGWFIRMPLSKLLALEPGLKHHQ